MTSRRATFVIFAVLAACKRDPEPDVVAAPPDRRTRCTRIADDITSMGMALAKGLTTGLSDGKAKLDGKEEAALQRELDTAKTELIAQCMDWPEEALECFGLKGALESADCERILAQAMGEPVLPADVPPGPTPAWQHELPHDLDALVGRDDGTVIAVVEPEDAPSGIVIAIKDGKETWRHELAAAPFAVESLGESQVLTVGDHDLHAIDAATGTLAWAAKSLEGEDGPNEMIALARSGDAIVILDEAHTLARVQSERCATKGPCLERIATLELPESSGTMWLEPGPANTWVVVAADDGAAHVFDDKGKRRFTIAAHTTLSWVTAAGDDLRVGLDAAVAVLDPSRCGTDGAAFAPIAWPPEGKPKWLKDATVREVDVAPTPAGCVRWQAPLAISDASDRVTLAGPSTLAQSGGFLFAFDAQGTRTLKTAVAAESFVVTTADGLAVVGDLGGDSMNLVLTWLSTDGKHLRRSPVPLGVGKMLLFDDVALTDAGPQIVVGLQRTLVAFEG